VVANKSIDKIIFDLRNNPGGYLSEVSTMLSYFIDEWSPTAIIDYGSRELEYSSVGYDLIDFSNYELIFIQNGGSASASEIMVGSVKDYYADAVIIGEQSYGKWSVQSLKTYNDGSTLKFTSAKWFTGNTKQGIDGVGITPDIELEFDSERWKTFKKDNQLEKAISY
jgi:carboxyl-terminal processing protease